MLSEVRQETGEGTLESGAGWEPVRDSLLSKNNVNVNVCVGETTLEIIPVFIGGHCGCAAVRR